MQNKLSKKAMPNIVGIVFLILIAILAVALLVPYIKKNTNLSPQIDCLELRTNLPVLIKQVCYNSSSSDLQVRLERRISSEINNLLLDVSYNSKSETYEIGGDCSSGRMLKEGESRIYYISSSNPKTIVTRINACSLESSKIENC